MNKLLNYRRFIVHLIGILPLIMSLGTSKVALAATATSDITLSLVAHRVGDTITYTATMTNLEPDDSVATDVGFPLPDQLRLVSMTCGSFLYELAASKITLLLFAFHFDITGTYQSYQDKP